MNLSRSFRFPPTLAPQLRSNFIYLFIDITWWGLYIGATLAFLNIYAARVGATPEQIGLMAGLPSIVGMVLSLPVGRWLKWVSPTRATITFGFLARILLLFYPLLPWMFPRELQPAALLGLAVLTAIPTTVIGISFNQFFMDAVPLEWRGSIVGTRMAILAIMSFATTVVSGQILTRVPFPANYQIVFFIGFVGGIATIAALSRVKPVACPPTAPPETPLPGAVRGERAPGPRPGLGVEERRYLKVILLLFLFTTSSNIVNPLVPDLLVVTLRLSEAQISFGTAGSTMLVFLVSVFIARITRRAGNRPATAVGAMLLAFQAFALAAARDVSLYLVSMAAVGLSTGLLNSAQYNYHLENVPAAERSTWLSWNQILTNAAILLASVAGPVIARANGTPQALLLFGGLRFAVGLAILLWG